MSVEVEHIEDIDDKPVGTSEGRSTRGRFLKRVGMTLAAAVGVAAAYAAPAYAAGNCCKDCGRCGTCASGKCFCWCDCSAVGGQSYCWTAQSGCLSSGCVPCPC